MAVLVEVHDARRTRARAAAEDAAGRHQQPQPAHASRSRSTPRSACCRSVPADRLLVTESGILAPRRRRSACATAGVHAFLVGEAFMRAPDPGAALADAVPVTADDLPAASCSTAAAGAGRPCCRAGRATLPDEVDPQTSRRVSADAADLPRRSVPRAAAGRAGRGAGRRSSARIRIRPPARPTGWRSRPVAATPPPSLRNIFEELARDRPGLAAPATWQPRCLGAAGRAAAQYRADGRSRAAPASHEHCGWEALTDQIVAALCAVRPRRPCSCSGAQHRRKCVLRGHGAHLVGMQPPVAAVDAPPVLRLPAAAFIAAPDSHFLATQDLDRLVGSDGG